MKFIKKIKTFKYKHPQLSIIILFLGLNMLILFGFSIAIALVEEMSLLKSFIYVITSAFMPDKIFDFKNGEWEKSHFIQLGLSICEMILLSGAIIGFVTNLFSDFFEKNSKAQGKISYSNHFVFLNWSNVGPNLIYDLSFSDDDYDVVILTDRNREEVINAIDSIFISNKRKNKNLNIIVKEGTPFSIKNLKECNITEAKSIAIMMDSDERELIDFNGVTDKGINSLKLLMTISDIITSSTNVVLEVDTEESVKKIRELIKTADVLKEKKVSVFSYNSVLGHIIGQILMNPLYSKFYYEVLSFDGVEFYSVPNKTIEDCLRSYDNCVPVIEYDDDRNGTLDQVYVLASDKEMVQPSKNINNNLEEDIVPLKFNINIESKEGLIVIIGDNRKSRMIADEIKNFNITNNSDVRCEIVSGNTNVLDVINRFDGCVGCKKIIITSDEHVAEGAMDANIFLSLLDIKANDHLVKGIDIFTEVINPANYEPASNFGVEGIVISNKFISFIILQLLTHPDSSVFYNDLISMNTDDTGGTFDIQILKASELLDMQEEIKFQSKYQLMNSYYIASSKKSTILGYIKNDEIIYLNEKNNNKEEIIITPDTVLVVTIFENYEQYTERKGEC